MEPPRKGNVNCVLKACKNTVKNTTSEIKFHIIPSAKAEHKSVQREKWIEWIKQANSNGWQPTKWSRICSMHFFANEVSNISSSPSHVPSFVYRRSADILAKEKAVVERFKAHIISTRQKRITTTTCANNAPEMSESSKAVAPYHCTQCSYQSALPLDHHNQKIHGTVRTTEPYPATFELELYPCRYCSFKSYYKISQYEHCVHEHHHRKHGKTEEDVKTGLLFYDEFEAYQCAYCTYNGHSSLSFVEHDDSCRIAPRQTSVRTAASTSNGQGSTRRRTSPTQRSIGSLAMSVCTERSTSGT